MLLAALWADPIAALVLFLCGLLVPVAMALAGIGAAAASRNQFLAMARLQARFLDRVRGIATIVLYGRAADEAKALAAAADELRARTMRVLRVAFLSSASLDLAAAAALIVLAVRYGMALLAHRLAYPDMALFVLLLVPEFFAPLRVFAAAYQDRLHATGAAESLIDLPPLPEPAPPRDVRTVEARGVTVAFDNVSLTWDPSRGPALDGLSFRVPAGEIAGAGRPIRRRQIHGDRDPARLRPPRQRQGDDQRRRHYRPRAAGAVPPDRLDRPAPGAVRRHHPRQHPLRPPRGHRRGDRGSRPQCPRRRVRRAALPDGLDTKVGEGGYGLSGGQAQRVAIARAFLKNAPLLLLDEPTSHLDPATEAEVLESLRRLALGRTVILASHSAAAHAFGGRRLDIRDGRAMVPARGAA